MDKKSCLKKVIEILAREDFGKVSTAERHARYEDIFESLQACKLSPSSKRRKAFEAQWSKFMQQLVEVEEKKEEISTFLCKKFHGSDEFLEYSKFTLHLLVIDNLNEYEIFQHLCHYTNRSELIRAIRENCAVVPTEVCYQYLNTRVIPAIFTPLTSKEERQELCDLVMALPLGFAYHHMLLIDQQKFRNDAMENYVPFIWSRCFGSDWQIMCMALLHYTGRLLHIDNTLTNAILKIVESAFKNAIVEQRCAAFECWRVVINNYALDKDFMMQSSKAGLLMKPLQARISRNRLVTEKKFDLYVHFLQQVDFAKVYVETFFKKAFGPFNEEIKEFERSDSIGHFRDMVSTSAQSTEILRKILGHTLRCNCFNNIVPVTDVFHIKVVNVENEVYTWQLLVDSVRVCSQINYKCQTSSETDVVLKCLWTSLMCLCLDEKYQDSLKSNLNSIANAIKRILNSPAMDAVYYKQFFNRILDAIIQYIGKIDYSSVINTELVQQILSNLLELQNSNGQIIASNAYGEFVHELVIYANEDPEFLTTLMTCIDLEELRCQMAADSLLTCLNANCSKLSGEQRNEMLRESMKIIIAINTNLEITTPTFPNTLWSFIDCKQSFIEQVFENCLNDNAHLIGLYKVISSCLLKCVNEKDTQLSSNYLLGLLLKCLAKFEILPSAESSHLPTSSTTLVDALKNTVEQHVAHRDMQMIYKIICSLLKVRVFAIFDCLIQLVQDAESCDIPEQLDALLDSLKDDSEASEKVKTVADLVRIAKTKTTTKVRLLAQTIVLPSHTIVSPKRKNTVQLFGKTFDSPSATFRESILEQAKEIKLPPRISQSTPPPLVMLNARLDDLSESAFVVSDKQVIVDKSLMTDDQKDKTRKRRDDIPALYNDLSATQSQSRDLATTNKELSPKSNNTSFETENGLDKNENDENDLSHTKSASEGTPKSKKYRELTRLRMNIVDADSFKFCGRTRQSSFYNEAPVRRKLRKSKSPIVDTTQMPNQDIATSEKSASVAIEENHNQDIANTNDNEKSATMETEEKPNENMSDNEKSSSLETKEQTNEDNEHKSDNDHEIIESSSVETSIIVEKKTTASYISPLDDLSVTIFRLPIISPTSREIAEAKANNAKLQMTKVSPLVCKIDFDNMGTEDHSTSETSPITDASPESEHADEELAHDSTLSIDVLTQFSNPIDVAEAETQSFVSEAPAMPLESPNRDDMLAASPIFTDTPTRNRELVDSASDISPIPNLDIPLSPDMPVLEIMEEIPRLKSPSSRSAKLLSLIGQNIPVKKIVSEILQQPASPKAERVLKMMQNCNDKSEADGENADGVEMNVLEFNRPVPSPLAKPGSSILRKRKMSPEFSECGLSPLAKRKRVNFPDPPTTCEKVYYKLVKDDDTYCLRRRPNSPIGVHKKKTKVQNDESFTSEATRLHEQDGEDDLEGVHPFPDELAIPTVAFEQEVESQNPEVFDEHVVIVSNPSPEMLFDEMITSQTEIHTEPVPAIEPTKISEEELVVYRSILNSMYDRMGHELFVNEVQTKIAKKPITSSKRKCKRQKDLERINRKWRHLMSYAQ